MIETMIYVHIPFCDSKCLYCNFVSGIYSEEIKQQYFLKLNKEIEYNANKKYIVTSIYIGGGTPSSIDSKYVVELINNIFTCFTIKDDVEITIEANPCSLTRDKLHDYKNCKINRLSIGVQSLDNYCLKKIGRKHTRRKALKAINLARQCGFNNINADILIGIPNQTYHKLKSTTKALLKKVSHISAYMLINEPNTPLTKMIANNEVKVVDEDKCVSFYDKIVKYLNKKHFTRYEVSNFAKNDMVCKHNMGYWQCKNYLGFGVSSHSYFLGERYYNTSNILEYIHSEFNYEKHKLTYSEKIEEYLMLGLRTKYGVNIEKLRSLGFDILTAKKTELDMLVSNDFIQILDGAIIVNNDKFGVLNQIILKLLPN